MSDDVFLNIHGLVRVLQLPRDWLLAEAKAGRIPCLSIGNKFRFNVDAVKAALAVQAATAAAENGTAEGVAHAG